MRGQGTGIRKPFRPRTNPWPNFTTKRGLTPVRPSDDFHAVGYQGADYPMVYQLYQLLFNAVSEDTSLMEEFFGNDSLGG